MPLCGANVGDGRRVFLKNFRVSASNLRNTCGVMAKPCDGKVAAAFTVAPNRSNFLFSRVPIGLHVTVLKCEVMW